MEFRDVSDQIIQSFFDEYSIKEEFYSNLEKRLLQSEEEISQKIESIEKKSEKSNTTLESKHSAFVSHLDLLNNFYNEYDDKVVVLNKHHSEKLTNIASHSKTLSEFENIHFNIEFAFKVFNELEKLNDPNSTGQIPEIFSIPEKVLDEGIELFEAFRQIVDFCKDYPIFVKNFHTIEKKMETILKDCIRDFYENNELSNLEKLFKNTEKIHSDLLIDMYTQYIIESMNINFMIDSLRGVNYSNIDTARLDTVLESIKIFHDTILRECYIQFGHNAAKIIILFPENRHNIVISNLVYNISKSLKSIRELINDESNKSDSVYIRITEFVYPLYLTFLEKFKDILALSKSSDLWNHIEQETRIFLRGLEAIYISKEKNCIHKFLVRNYLERMKELSKLKHDYNKTIKSTQSSDLNLKIKALNELQSKSFELINSTNYPIIVNEIKSNISRFQLILDKVEERLDMTETYIKDMLDTMRDLLQTYSNTFLFIIQEHEKYNLFLTDFHFFCFSKYNFMVDEVDNIFRVELKSLFATVNIIDEVEDALNNRIAKINTSFEDVFSKIESMTSSRIRKILLKIPYKTIYNLKKPPSENRGSEDIESLIEAVFPLFDIISSWPERYKKKICQMITKMVNDKFIDILKNAAINENGAKQIKIDFCKVFNLFDDKLEAFFSNQIYDVLFLVDIFLTPQDSVDGLVYDMANKQRESKRQRYDEDQVKYLVKRRKNLKY